MTALPSKSDEIQPRHRCCVTCGAIIPTGFTAMHNHWHDRDKRLRKVAQEAIEALRGSEYYLRVDLDSLKRDRAYIERPEDRRDQSGEGEEICGEVLGLVRASLDALRAALNNTEDGCSPSPSGSVPNNTKED